MKTIAKKWWIFLYFLIVIIILAICWKAHIEKKEVEKTVSNIGKSATDFLNDTDNAESHLEEFSNNYKDEVVEYKPSKITLDKYETIKEDMEEEEVISILGQYDKRNDGENTFLLEWGNSYSPVYDGYWIQIIFNNKDKKVLSKSQIGLK